MQRFEGKRQVISKEGLNKLLHSKGVQSMEVEIKEISMKRNNPESQPKGSIRKAQRYSER